MNSPTRTIKPVAALACFVLSLAPLSAADPETKVLAATLPAAVQPGDWFTISYHLMAKEPMKENKQIFLHVLDSTGKTVAQNDHVPPGTTMQSTWQGAVNYSRPMKLPADLPEGAYRIVMGLYTEKGRDTLATGPGVEDIGEQRYLVGTIQVDKNAPKQTVDTEKPKTLNLDGYKMTFSEEFDGPLDVSPWGPGTRWIAHTPWNGDFGDAEFADPKEGFPFTVKDGILRIEARKDDAFAKTDPYGRKWKAGLLASNDAEGKGFSQQYGYFEMRAKMPPGPGVWPAFWLGSSYDRTNKENGLDGAVEIDVIEYYGHEPSAYCAVVHVWEPKPHRGSGTVITTKPNEVTDGFHNYGVMVQPDFITMYFDGIEVWKVATPPEHNKPLFILLNLALGSGWPIDQTPNPSVMEVDYVRAYAK